MDLATLGIRIENGDVVKATASLDAMTTAGGRTERQIGQLASSARTAVTAFAGGFFGAHILREMIETTDAMKRVDGQLKIVTQSATELKVAEANLFAVAQRTRQHYGDVAELYARVTRSTRELALSQKDLVGVTEAVSRAVLISNVSTQTAQAGMYQLSQAFAAGRLQGQDFKAVIEDIPRLGQAIAEGLGVSMGKLREMSQAGEVTSAKMVEALQKSNAALVSESAQMPKTVGQGFVYLQNATAKWLAEQDHAVGATAAMASGLKVLGDNLDIVAKGAAAVAAVYAVRWGGEGIQALYQFGHQLTLTRAETAAYTENTVRLAAAKRGETESSLAAAQARRAELLVMQQEIVAQRELAVAQVQAAQTRLAGAVNPATLAPLGGAAVTREIAAQNAARRQLNTALIAGNDAAARAIVVERELAATETAVATSSASVTAAKAREAQAIAATSTSARIATGAVSTLNAVLAPFGGPIGVAIIAAALTIRHAFEEEGKGAREAAAAVDEYRQQLALLTPEQLKAQKAAVDTALALQHARTESLRGQIAQLPKAGDAGFDVNTTMGQQRTLVQQLNAAVDIETRLRAMVDATTSSLTRNGSAAAEAAKKFQDQVREREAEINKMEALNAAYDRGALAVKELEIQKDAEIQKAKDAGDYSAEERVQLDALTDRKAAAAIAAARLAEQLEHERAIADKLRATWKQQADEHLDWAKQVKEGTDSLHEESDAADRQLAALRNGVAAYQEVADSIEAANRAKAIGLAADDANYDAVVAETKALIEKNRAIKEQVDLQKSLATGVTEATKGIKEKLDDALKAAAERQEQYSRDMGTIWRDGIGKITTDGFKSFQDFFEDVFQLFSKLMKRMEQEGNTSGMGYRLLGYAQAGIAGGMTGYQLGSQYGSNAGFFGGAAAGAAMGSQFGPWGAAIGGIAGAAGGLLGAAKAHAEAAKQLREAADHIRDNITSYVMKANGSDLQSRLYADTQEYKALLKELSDVYDKGGMSMREFTSQVEELNRAHEALTETLKHEAEMARARDEMDLRAQILDAQGDTAGAAELRRQMQLWEAINSGKGPEYIALLQQLQDIQRANEATAKAQQEQADAEKKAADEAAKQKELLTQLRDAAQAMADDLQRQTDAQQRTVDGLRNVINSLAQWRQSLALNPSLSILSPKDQADQAMAAYRALVAKAMTGDASAAAGLQDAATTALNAGEKYYAHGMGYVDIYREIMASSGAVQDQFGAQLSTEERVLAELQKQTAQMQHQVDLLNQQLGVQKKSSQLDYATAIVNNANQARYAWDGQGQDPMVAAISTLRQMFPGLAVMLNQRTNSLYLGNSDFSSPAEYWANAYRNVDPSELDDATKQMLHGYGVPGYAAGGDFGGGLRLVGEEGPELEVTGPSRIVSNRDVRGMLATGNKEVVAELKELTGRADLQLRELRAAVRLIQADAQATREEQKALRNDLKAATSQRGLAGEVSRARRDN